MSFKHFPLPFQDPPLPSSHHLPQTAFTSTLSPLPRFPCQVLDLQDWRRVNSLDCLRPPFLRLLGVGDVRVKSRFFIGRGYVVGRQHSGSLSQS